MNKYFGERKPKDLNSIVRISYCYECLRKDELYFQLRDYNTH